MSHETHTSLEKDGFRCLVFRDGDDVELGSRGGKPLTRYFPELIASLAEALPPRCVLDGEIVVVQGSRLDFDRLSDRIHPAESRIRLLAEQTPATFVAFDVLALGDEDLTGRPLAERHEVLTRLFAPHPQVRVSRATQDVALARTWFETFEGAGLDGVVAKRLDDAYRPGERAMVKVKHERTADVRRAELVDELAPLVLREGEEHPWTGEDDGGHRRPGALNRWNAGKDRSFVALRPERVCEVRYDQLQADRFRHSARFLRWRPDRQPESCGYDQLDVPAAYDLAEVLGPDAR